MSSNAIDITSDLVMDLERSLQTVRYQSEDKTQRLRKELEDQRTELLAKKCELQLALSEISSFEKEELLARVEKLESKLEGECKEAVLMKIQIAVLEQELKLKAEKKKHVESSCIDVRYVPGLIFRGPRIVM
jgi:hypothetical protein